GKTGVQPPSRRPAVGTYVPTSPRTYGPVTLPTRPGTPLGIRVQLQGESEPALRGIGQLTRRPDRGDQPFHGIPATPDQPARPAERALLRGPGEVVPIDRQGHPRPAATDHGHRRDILRLDRHPLLSRHPPLRGVSPSVTLDSLAPPRREARSEKREARSEKRETPTPHASRFSLIVSP